MTCYGYVNCACVTVLSNWSLSTSSLPKRGRSEDEDETFQIAKKKSAHPSIMPSSSKLRTGSSTSASFLQNRFQVLESNSASSGNDPSNTETIANNSEKKFNIPPPIIIKGMQYNDLRTFLSSKQLANYIIKIMSIGIKLHLKTKTDFDLIKSEFVEKKIEFFTHDLKDNKTKYVLSGLPNLSLDEVKAGLVDAGLTVIDLHKMRGTLSDNHALYVIVVENLKFTELKRIKYVLNTVINWRKYIIKRKGPIQCYRCFLYGHGERNCHLSQKCPNCSGNHKLPECNIKEATIKCCNCGGNHQATANVCPSRDKFIKIKQNLASNSNAGTSRRRPNPATITSTTKRQPFVINDLAFPEMKPVANPIFNWGEQVNLPQKPQKEPENLSSELPGLFNPNELMAITTELLMSLRNCKSRLEQFQAIARLTFKHVYGVTP